MLLNMAFRNRNPWEVNLKIQSSVYNFYYIVTMGNILFPVGILPRILLPGYTISRLIQCNIPSNQTGIEGANVRAMPLRPTENFCMRSMLGALQQVCDSST